jgi:hypothetical protein
MQSGFSHYLFVGGSTFGGDISKTSFDHITTPGNCTGAPSRHMQYPFGPSKATSPQGSFSTTGTLAAIAGVAISGYSVKGTESNFGFDGYCGGPGIPSDFPQSASMFLTTKGFTPGEIVVIIVGTAGIGTLAPSWLHQSGVSGCGNEALTTLRNVTVNKGRYDGTSVGVFSTQLSGPLSYCDFSVYGTTYNSADQSGMYAIWMNAYYLVPLGG